MTESADKIKIQTLDYPHNVRKRQGMYAGSADNPNKILSEISDNSVDEIITLNATKVYVHNAEEGDWATVVDNGRGVPIYLDDDGESVEKKVFSRLHSSSKFEDSEVTAGMNGVGAAVTNALSEEFIVYINIGKLDLEEDSKDVPDEYKEEARSMESPVYLISWKKGILSGDGVLIEFIDCPDFILDMGMDFGTGVTFLPDPELWDTTETDLSSATLELSRYLIESEGNDQSELSIMIDGEEVQAFNVKEYFQRTEFIDDKLVKHSSDLSVESTKEDSKISLKFMLEFGYSANDFDFRHTGSVNTLATPDGWHILQAKKAIGHMMMNLTSGLTLSDGYYGLRLFSMVLTNKAMFDSQTKVRLEAIEGLKGAKRVYEVLGEDLLREVLQDTDLVKWLKSVGARILEYKRQLGNMSVSSMVETAIQTGDSKTNRGKGSKLYDCTCRDRSEGELFIVEGDSAAGSLVQSRDTAYHAILPLRGKVMNTANRDVVDFIENKEILATFNAIGAGMTGFNMDVNNSRYGKIVFATDADPDGKAIMAVLAGNFGKYLRELVEEGMLYYASIPLYGQRVKDGEMNYYWSEERDQLDDSKPFTRFKGLGEMNPDQIALFTFNPDYRRLVKITMDDYNNAMNLVAFPRYRRSLMITNDIVIDPELDYGFGEEEQDKLIERCMG